MMSTREPAGSGARPGARAGVPADHASGGWGGKMPSRLSIHVSAKAAAPTLGASGVARPPPNRATGARALRRAGRLAYRPGPAAQTQVHHAAALVWGGPGHRHLRLAGLACQAAARRPWPGAPGGHRQWCQSRGRPAPPSRPRSLWAERPFGRLYRSPATRLRPCSGAATSKPTSVTSALSPLKVACGSAACIH